MRRLKLAAAVILLLATNAAAQLAIRGELVHTMEGEPLKQGVVLIKDGKIEAVGPQGQTVIPKGYKVLNAKVVTPGLIDARTSVGLSGYMNQPHDQMQLDLSSPIQPELQALDGYNAQERLVTWLRELGVTTVHTGPSSGALMPGQTMVIKTHAPDAQRALLKPAAMVAVTLGQGALVQGGKAPGTRSKSVAMLRAELQKAKEYLRKKETAKEDARPESSLKYEVLAKVLRREMPLLVNAQRAHDILTALRVAKEFEVNLVLDGASEAHLVIPQLAEAKVPVIVHATMVRGVGESENLSMETASLLRKAGIPVALQSGFEGYVPKNRVVLFEAAIAAANGLTPAQALAAITSDAASLLGVADRVGSLRPGKDADVVMFDGDPFEFTTHVTGVVVDGQVVSQTVI